MTGYLDSTFRNDSPNDYDIISALYGTPDEEGMSIYTQHRNGYNSWSCLNPWMTVEYTWQIPAIINPYTIYVIASGTYDVSSPIVMEKCSALISSGIVILSSDNSGSGVIVADDVSKIIIEKIRIDSQNNGKNGLFLIWGDNITIKDFQAYNNVAWSTAGIYLSGFSYGDIINTQSYSNSNGALINNSSHVWINNFQTRNNLTMWVQLLYSNSINLTDITYYDNFNIGFFIRESSLVTINNLTWYNNALHGLMILNSSGNTINNIDMHDNGMRWIFMNLSENNILQNISSTHNENGLALYNSTGNILSGITVFGNYYGGIDFYNTNYNTWTNITSNSSSGCLYLDTSTHNNFINITTENSPDNGIVILWSSNYNTFSGLLSSGNMGHGVYMSDSDHNTITHSTSTYNHSGWIIIETWISNHIIYSNIIWNTNNGIFIENGSWNIINSSMISLNQHQGISIVLWINNQILNSNIQENGYCGIAEDLSQSAIISWNILSWNNFGVMVIYAPTNANITNNTNYGGGNTHFGWGSGNIIISSFSWNDQINVSIRSWTYNTNIDYPIYYFDAYTKSYSYITYMWYPYFTLTWSLIVWSQYYPDFNKLTIFWDPFSNYNNILFSWVTSFTVSWATRDGRLYSPTQITVWPKLWELGETWTQLITTFVDTMEVISGNTYLTVNWGTTTIIYQFPGWTSWQFLGILKSNDGNTWSANTPNNWCILDEFLYCTFVTSGTIKLFSFWTPWLYFTGTTQSGIIITNGGYYNTGVRIAFTWLNISWALLNSTPYTNNALITWDGSYTFVLEDNEGNTTGITFTIDKIKPVFTGTTLGSLISGNVISGGYYNTWITINFNDLYISGAIVSGMNISYYSGNFTDGEIVSSEWTYIFTVYDLADNSTGMIFTIDMTNPSVTANYPTSGLNITGTNNIAFSWTGFDETAISGYTLYVTWSYQHTITTTNTGYTIHTMNNALDYTRYVIITDRAGNTGMSQILPFMITTPLSGQAVLTGTNRYYVTPYRYVKAYASIDLRANQPYKYLVTWSDIVNSITGGLISWHIVVNPQLTGNDGLKTVQLSLENASGDTVTLPSLSVYLDTTVISPTLSSPLSWASVSGNVVLSRSGVSDAVGISWYRYYVSDTTGFTIIRRSWSTTTATQTTIPNLTLSNWIYYRYVTATDNLGNSWYSTTSSFIYSGILDTTPNTFSFNDIDDADLDETYMSNTITISGLSTGTQVLASITRGMLYISGNAVGTTWYVQNGWTVKIELISSDEYDDSVESTLTIDSKSDTFKVTTKEEDDDVDDDYDDIDTDLSNTEKLIVVYLFETLRDLYAGDKEEEFFNTLMLMLEEKMDDIDDEDDTEWQALKYLYDLADQYYESDEFGEEGIDIMDRIKNGIYTAPNGKKYIITYDSTTQRFTSTNFVVPKYFPTLDTLKYIIDINNPAGSQYANAKPILARWKNARIDGIWQTSPFTAPNKKVFYFFKDINGRYSSYTFTSERYFSSLDDVKEFIYNSNKK